MAEQTLSADVRTLEEELDLSHLFADLGAAIKRDAPPPLRARRRTSWKARLGNGVAAASIAFGLVAVGHNYYRDHTPMTQTLEKILDFAGEGDAIAQEIGATFKDKFEWLNPKANEMRASISLRQLYEGNPSLMRAYLHALEEKVENCTNGVADNCFDYLQKDILNAFHAYGGSVEYLQWDNERSERFRNTIETDPLLVNARLHWSGENALSEEARADAIQHMIDLHAQAYSDDVFLMTSALFNRSNIENATTQAHYGADGITMRAGDIMSLPFDEVVEAVAHEGRHLVQDHLIRALNDGSLSVYLEINGIRDDAEILRMAWGPLRVQYQTKDGVTPQGYWINPIEQNARLREEDGTRAGALHGIVASAQEAEAHENADEMGKLIIQLDRSKTAPSVP